MNLNVDDVVRERYTQGALERVDSLCCPTSYDGRYLEVLPREIMERDYGCGDPSAYLREGETVLDLGSGGGKICYIAAQIVGRNGRVIGVDTNEEMLALARRYQPEIAARVGYDNVSFRRGKIQDLLTDIDAIDTHLRAQPIGSAGDLHKLERFVADQRRGQPLIEGESVDVVVSNCVFNLITDDEKPKLLEEVFRVLRRGGRAVISDIVSDEAVSSQMKQDPELWSGCIAGAYREQQFLDAFAAAGFHGIELVKRDERPWRTVGGIEFRSVTVQAWKGKQGECWDCNQAVIYRGPWSEVRDDDGHTLHRGVPMAVCEKTFRLYTKEPYGSDIIPVQPRMPVPIEEAKPFDCSRDAVRHPRETKGVEYLATTEAAGPCCAPGSSCG